MTRQSWAAIGPQLVLAGGIIVSTAVAVAVSGPAWMAAVGPLLFVLFMVGADMWNGRLRRESMAPSFSMILMAAAFLVACGMVAMKHPASVAMLIPILGSGAVIPILFRRRASCP